MRHQHIFIQKNVDISLFLGDIFHMKYYIKLWYQTGEQAHPDEYRKTTRVGRGLIFGNSFITLHSVPNNGDEKVRSVRFWSRETASKTIGRTEEKWRKRYYDAMRPFHKIGLPRKGEWQVKDYNVAADFPLEGKNYAIEIPEDVYQRMITYTNALSNKVQYYVNGIFCCVNGAAHVLKQSGVWSGRDLGHNPRSFFQLVSGEKISPTHTSRFKAVKAD